LGEVAAQLVRSGLESDEARCPGFWQVGADGVVAAKFGGRGDVAAIAPADAPPRRRNRYRLASWQAVSGYTTPLVMPPFMIKSQSASGLA
jgi:hypothetical protein